MCSSDLAPGSSQAQSGQRHQRHRAGLGHVVGRRRRGRGRRRRRLGFGLSQRKLALFRIGRGLFERIEEDRWSSLDMEVHEHPIVEGKLGEIKVRIDHDDEQGLRNFIRKHTDYAQWEAQRYLLMRSAKRDANALPLTLRQRTKYRFITAWWYPAAYFVYAYVIRLGFLDGRAGFVYAAMKFWYFTLIQSFIAEILRRPA